MSRKKKPAAPEQPVIRRGDVLATLHNEIAEAFRIAAAHRALVGDLARYQRAHPEEHAHLAAFLNRQPSA